MSVHRKRFRIEEVFGTPAPVAENDGGEPMPMHREIMTELRAIRAQMAAPASGPNAVSEEVGAAAQKQIEEAQSLLAEYQKKRVEAEKHAAEIVAQAKVEAETYSVETRKKLAETIERRTKQAAQKIAQAEAAAVKEVRTSATEAAIAAATKLVGEAMQGTRGAKLVDESIAAVKSRLN